MKCKVLLLAALMAATCVDSAICADCGTAAATTQGKARPRTTTRRSSTTQNVKGKYQTFKKEQNRTVPNPYFDSSEEVSTWNPREVNTTLSVKISWPTSIPGVTDLKPIYDYIIGTVLDQESTDISLDDAMSDWLNDNAFDDIAGFFDPSESLIFAPVVETSRFVTFEISDIIDNGGGMSAGFAELEQFIVFDKNNNQFFTGDIFKDIDSPALLALVNTYVRRGQYGFGDAERVPESIMPEETKLTIIYPKYEIACGAEGNVHISIPYSKLLSYLTPEFRALIGK